MSQTEIADDAFGLVMDLLRTSIRMGHGLKEQDALKLAGFAEDLFRERDRLREELAAVTSGIPTKETQ